ncbi:MAG TPA: right-handed parallel beta-helix repeat-containing protein [Edaphocola sp.]|nr:right-handed parallel beta-helix repeat-containing protein [Edaphocola sp.]
MKKISFLISISLCLLLVNKSNAQINTPSTGVNWNMDSLVANYPLDVQFSNNEYLVTQKIIFKANDTFSETQNHIVKFSSNGTFEFNQSVVDIDVDSQMMWIAADTTLSFPRIKFDQAVSSNVKNLAVNYSNGISVINCDVNFSNLNMEKTYHKSPNPSGALSALNSNISVDSSRFFESQRSAIALGANSGASVNITNSWFEHNDYSNGNYPQVNIGTTNSNGAIIDGCTFIGKYTKSGGLAFLNISGSNFDVLVQNNYFYQNRYGIALNGRGINATILNNVIDSNNIEGLPMLGGSGINILGDSSINVIAANNEISRNLWGVTIQKNASAPKAPIVSFGKINPTNPIDTGGNYFWANENDSTLFAIYNNTPDTVYAQRNRWDFEIVDSIETTIFHHFDDSTLGWVLYDSFYVTPPEPPVDTSTGITSILKKGNFAQLFPNPTTGKNQTLNILSAIPLKEMRVIDLQGREVMHKILNNEKETFLSIDQFETGLYWIWLTNGQEQQFLRWSVIKE